MTTCNGVGFRSTCIDVLWYPGVCRPFREFRFRACGRRISPLLSFRLKMNAPIRGVQKKDPFGLSVCVLLDVESS